MFHLFKSKDKKRKPGFYFTIRAGKSRVKSGTYKKVRAATKAMRAVASQIRGVKVFGVDYRDHTIKGKPVKVSSF